MLKFTKNGNNVSDHENNNVGSSSDQVQRRNSKGAVPAAEEFVFTVDPSRRVEDPPPWRNHEDNVKSFEEILEDLGCFGPFQALTLFLYLFMEVAAAFVAFIPICIARSRSTVENCTEHDTISTTTYIPTFDTSDFTTDFFNESFDGIVSTTSSSNFVDSIEDSLIGLTTYFTKSLLDDFKNVFENPFKYETLADEWNLKCGRAWIPDVFTSLLMAGMAAGNLIWSQVADWYGRRKAYLGLLMVLFTGTIMSAISPSVYLYALSRFICGSGYSGFINVSSMSVIEFMTPQWRSLANMAGPMGEGIMLLSLLGYYIRPWRQLYLATLTPYILIIPIYFFLPESPRWLLRNKKVAEAHAVLGYMAKINGRDPVSMSVLEALRKREEISSESQKKTRVSYLDFLKNKQLLKTGLFLFAMWFSWNVSYYGISYNIRNVPGSVYLNLALIGLANAIGQRSSMPASDRFGRRKAVLYGMTLSAAFLVMLAICFVTLKDGVNPKIILVACFVALFGQSSTRASLRLLSGESFPTAVRTMGLATGGLGANIAGLLTPQTAYLGSRWPALPFFIFATVSVLGSLVVLLMKETTGNPLSDEIKANRKKSIPNNHQRTTARE